MKNSWEKQQDGVIFKKIGIWDTLLKVFEVTGETLLLGCLMHIKGVDWSKLPFKKGKMFIKFGKQMHNSFLIFQVDVKSHFELHVNRIF